MLGGIRASAQMISYEIAMGLSIISFVMMTGTLSLRDITLMQAGGVGSEWNCERSFDYRRISYRCAKARAQ